ncbi:MAG TPA: hypothetical protein VEB68_10455 [Croceibacterium sp.]|nr:hypothetical protein [Croceibacterium sp.]
MNLAFLFININTYVDEFRSDRHVKQLIFAVDVSWWMFVAAICAGSLVLEWNAAWELSDKIIEPVHIAEILLGVGALFGLAVALTEVRLDQVPRAMNFSEVLNAGKKFIEKEVEFGKTVRMCAYYPNIGAATQDEYKKEYTQFHRVVSDKKVECVCLGREREGHGISDQELEALGVLVEGGRPKSIEQAVCAFAKLWKTQDGLNVGALRYGKALHDVDNLLDDQGELRVAGCFFPTQFVPDYHFILSGDNVRGSPHRAFLIVPILAAGMRPLNGTAEAPPMIGVVITDAEILRSLEDLWWVLKDSPLPSAASSDGSAALVTSPSSSADA